MKKVIKIDENTSKEVMLKLLEKNEKLQDDLLYDIQESEMFHIGDILDSFRDSLRDCSIGFNQENYIHIKKNMDEYYNFLNGLVDSNNDYGFLDNECMILVNKVINKIDILNNMSLDNLKYYDLENWIENKCNEIKDMVEYQFNLMTHITNEYKKDYFIEFYIEERLLNNDRELFYYEDTLEMIEHISYMKSYL